MTPARKHNFPATTVALGIFLLISGILAAIWWYTRPMVGDDIYYALDLRQRGGQLWNLPGHMAAVWFGCNGRLGEMLIPIWIEILPKWIASVIAFAATIVLPLTIIRLAGLRQRTDALATALCVALTAWLLPWWDMGHLVCITNYPWGACVALMCLIPLSENPMHGNRWLLGIPVAFWAGAYHEALGVPLSVGIIAWILFDNRKWKAASLIKKMWFIAIVAGGVFTLSSPAIWARAARMSTHVYSPLYILMSSANLSVALLIITIAIAVLNRKLLKRLLKDTWLIFFVASIASACIAAAGDAIGRSGLFAQIFSILALGRMYVNAGIRIKNNLLTITISCIIYVLLIVSAIMEYTRDHKTTVLLQKAYDIYPTSPAEAYDIVLSIDEYEEWDAASLKALDPRYDRLVDRNDNPHLAADSD